MVGLYCGRLTKVVAADIQKDEIIAIDLTTNVNINKLIYIDTTEHDEETLNAFCEVYRDVPEKFILTTRVFQKEGWQVIQVPIISIQAIRTIAGV